MPPTRLARAGLLLLALILAAAVAVLGAVSVQRKVAGFQPLGFAAEPADGGVRVTAVRDAATGLEPGDRVLDAEGVAAPRLDELAERLRGAAETPLLVLRGDAVVPLTYQRPALDVDVPYLILALVGAAFLAIGLYTLLRDRRRQAALFFLWCTASAALFLITPGELAPRPDALTKLLFGADMVARLLLPPLLLHLFLVFPETLVRARRLARWAPVLYLPAAALLALRLDLIATGGRLLGTGIGRETLRALDRAENGLFALYALAAVAVLVLRVVSEENWERARQVRWLVFGVAAGYLPAALVYLAPTALGAPPPELVAAAALAPLVLVPVAFAWAVLRYKLWDIESIVRDTIAATLTLLLGVIGFSLVNMALSRGLPAELVATRNLVSFAAGLAIAGLLLPTRRGIAAGLERIQYRGSYEKRRALGDLAEELIHERDLMRLCQRLIEHIEDGLEVERANLYLALGDTMIPVRPEPGLPLSIAAADLGERVWEAEHTRLSAVALPAAERPPQQKLFAAGYRYAFPLSVRDARIGLAVVGHHEDGTPLNGDDLELVRQLLNQAALAIENARLLDQLRTKLDEVVELQRYNQGIIESSPAGIAVLDADDRILSANAAFAELVRLEAETLAGRALNDVLPLPEVPAAGEPVREISFCEADGGERHLQISTAGFPRGNDQLRILVVHDVSERVAMEVALKEKDRLAALGALAAGVAHEVNTPITGISSYAQMLLAETDAADPRYAILKKVERQTFRATQIVNSLLEFARRRETDQAPLSLAGLVDECLDLLAPQLAKNRIRVVWRPDGAAGGDAADAGREAGEGGGLVVLGNAGELQQVVTNLLLNGCDAMAETGGELTVGLTALDGSALLTVADAGPGIPPDRLHKVFEPFFTTKLGRGTGLGLSISHEIVHRHGGAMRVESEPGRGARFTVELPLYRRG